MQCLHLDHDSYRRCTCDTEGQTVWCIAHDHPCIHARRWVGVGLGPPARGGPGCSVAVPPPWAADREEGRVHDTGECVVCVATVAALQGKFMHCMCQSQRNWNIQGKWGGREGAALCGTHSVGSKMALRRLVPMIRVPGGLRGHELIRPTIASTRNKIWLVGWLL